MLIITRDAELIFSDTYTGMYVDVVVSVSLISCFSRRRDDQISLLALSEALVSAVRGDTAIEMTALSSAFYLRPGGRPAPVVGSVRP